MATRTKTIRYAHPPLASMVDNTLTTLSQITVYIPETVVSFQSVVARVTAMATATGTGNVTSRRLQCRLGAAAYTTHTNSNVYTGSGEDIFVQHAVNLTAHFTTNWTGTSMTFDSEALLDGAQAGIVWTNICVEVYITYQYDDTAATHIKTVYIPLDMPRTNLATVKPASALTTIPNLSTELPEASKTFRNHFITVQGNVNRAAATDITMTMQLDTTTSHTTGVFEGLSNTDYFYRYIWDAPDLNTSASMGWFAWASATDFNHAQAWLTVTYEFDATASNNLFNSVMVPMELASPIGGTTSSDYQRGTREFWIQEPGVITTRQIAFFPFWDHAAAIAGLNFRIGTGAFLAYTNVAATLAGSNAAMVRNDAAFTLVRGRNTVNFDCYRTDTADFGTNISGFWILNYTSGKPSGGYGEANHTIFYNLGSVFDGAAASLRTIASVAPAISATNYFLNAVGINYKYHSNSTSNPAGISVTAERLASTEGGLEWEPIYVDVARTDPETGIHECWAQARSFFRRFPGDADPGRVDIETPRRWRAFSGNSSTTFDYLDFVITFHSINYTVADAISGFSGTVDLELHRSKDDPSRPGELVAATTRSGDGPYSFVWYDNTIPVFVRADDGTHVGTSQEDLAV